MSASLRAPMTVVAGASIGNPMQLTAAGNVNFKGRKMTLDLFTKRTGRIEFVTPKIFTDSIGPFDVDICAARGSYNKIGKRNYYGPTGSRDCGLKAKLKSSDFVWCNPPFGLKNGMREFIEKMAEHNNGILICPSLVGSIVFHEVVYPNAKWLYFFRGGFTFETLEGEKAISYSGMTPAILIGFGDESLKRVKNCTKPGRLVLL